MSIETNKFSTSASENGESNTFGELLAMFRKHTKFTQVDVQISLEKLNYTLDASTLSKYESGERRPSAHFIPFFVKALGLSKEDETTLLSAYLEDLRVTVLEKYLRGKSDVA